MRAETVTSLVAELREAVKTPISFLYMGDYLNNGIDCRAIERLVDRVEVLCYGNSPPQTRRAVAEQRARMERPDMLVVGLSGFQPVDSAPVLRDVLRAAHQAGARCFSYYNYGMIPRRHFRWIREALDGVRQLSL